MEPWLAPTREDLRWVHREPDPVAFGHRRAEAVLAGDAGITVLGSAAPPGGAECALLIRLTGAGEVVDERRYPAALGTGRAMAALPDGFVVAGEVPDGELAYRACLIRLDARAEVTGRGVFGPAGVTGFDAVTRLVDGSVLAAGTSGGPEPAAGGTHGWLVCVPDADRTGWETELTDVDGIRAVAVPAGGGFVAAARTQTSTTSLGRARLIGFADDRSVRWRLPLPHTGHGELTGLAALPHSGVVAVGHRTADGPDPAGLWVVRVDSAGALVWERQFGTGDGERRGRAVVALGGDGVAVAGEVLRGTRRTVVVARLTADGTPVWEREYGEERAYDLVGGLAGAADGGLVVAGSTAPVPEAAGPARASAIRVFRLDPDGTPVWHRLLTG